MLRAISDSSITAISLMVMIAAVGIFALAGCAGVQQVEEESEHLQIVTSISIVADITEQIVGERAQVEYLVPLGEEPEEYEPVPSDFQKVSDADAFFINGYNLEVWLTQITGNVADVPVVAAAEEGPTIPLKDSDAPDPHLWLNAEYVRDYYVEKILSTVVELDPDGEDYYRQRADNYAEELTSLHEYITEEAARIPEQKRVIITSENCFKYYAEAYGFESRGIWEINSPEEGTPQQIARIIELVEEREIPAVFRENTISPQYMESISEETGVAIGGVVYSDDLGAEGSGAETLVKMLKHNTDVFVEALTD